MLKLDEKGWGYTPLIVFGAIFIIFLVGACLAISFIKRETKKENNNPVPLNETKNYDRMYQLDEDKLENAGEYYVLDNETYFNNSSDNTKISLTYLVNNGYIEQIYDPIYEDPCEGFVIISKNKSVKSFIKCSNYTTNGYDNWS